MGQAGRQAAFLRSAKDHISCKFNFKQTALIMLCSDSWSCKQCQSNYDCSHLEIQELTWGLNWHSGSIEWDKKIKIHRAKMCHDVPCTECRCLRAFSDDESGSFILQVVNASIPAGLACRTLLSIFQKSPSLSGWLDFIMVRTVISKISIRCHSPSFIISSLCNVCGSWILLFKNI